MSRIQIVCFDPPHPPKNGGLIDVYYLIEALHQRGVSVYAHVFHSGGQPSEDDLREICHEVYYYPRRKGILQLLSRRPFMVSSRTDSRLAAELKRIGAPVILEGLHTTSVLARKDLELLIAVRTHNIEHEYYRSLRDLEPRLYYRTYLRREIRKLKNWERILTRADALFTLSSDDQDYFQRINENSFLVPVFHGKTVDINRGKGEYVLYHGNLAVAENHHSAMYLLEDVFRKSSHKLIVAGAGPRNALGAQIAKMPNVDLVADPDFTEMENLIKGAQINLLPSFTESGIKLKLINALFNGRHCITNEQMLKGSHLESCCHVYHDLPQLHQIIDELMTVDFKESMISDRREELEKHYQDHKNAQAILEHLEKLQTK